MGAVQPQWELTDGGLLEALSHQPRTRNPSEQRLVEGLQPTGATLLHKGCPDFLVFHHGSMCFIEVKHGMDVRSPAQQLFAAILESHNIPVFVSPDGCITKDIHDWFEDKVKTTLLVPVNTWQERARAKKGKKGPPGMPPHVRASIRAKIRVELEEEYEAKYQERLRNTDVKETVH
jgi:hypothetical protein